MIREIIKNNPERLISKAYKMAEKKHTGQRRKTGEPYFTHPVAVAEQLLRWRLDETSVAAGLLHDVLEDAEVTEEELKDEFGEEVTFLVKGVTKMGHIKYRGKESQIENLRKLLLAVGQDIRVIMIKLADRLHNMKTLSALPPQKQRRIALETAEIYAPIAYRLGMHGLSGELEDLSFPYLDPKAYEALIKLVGEKYGEREKYLERVKPVLEEALKKSGVEYKEIKFRAKKYFSLYKKLKQYDMDLNQVYDLIAFRVIVRRVEDCYATLGVIHGLWKPMPGRIKDYIAMPKPNGYRSLHTTVFCLEGKPVEFQIRTEEMDDEAENGAAAHWIYKRVAKGKTVSQKDARRLSEEARWVRDVRGWQSQFEKDEDFMEALKIDLNNDRIYVISPIGDVYDLPAGATPVDYAYQVHSEVGNETTGAKVNGKIVPLNYRLQSGDVVEILRQKNKKPSEDWLEFVKTGMAREHIRQAVKAKRKI